MHLKEELKITKPLQSGHEVALALLLTREYVARLFDEGLFDPEGISDPQYNILRILKGGPPEGYLIRDLRQRVIYRFADVPRLVNRLGAQGLVRRTQCPEDRRGSRIQITTKGLALEVRLRPQHQSLCERVARCLNTKERRQLLDYLERLRDDFREQLEKNSRNN